MISTLTAARSLAARRAARRPETPAELAARLIPGYRITPAVSLISDELHRAITEPDQRVIITCPPREGKSTLVAVVGTLFALSRNPDHKVILASYADGLAHDHSRAARDLIAEHPDLLGIRLSPDKTSTGRWAIDGHAGGLLAAGILSGITGFGADYLLVDDPVKNSQEADSAAQRRKVLHEFRSTLLTRVHPGGSVVIIGTRWNEDDLIGTLIREEPETWRHTNIPAVSEIGIPDALDREPGTAMTSALGRTAQQFDDLRRSVASRSWYALFQGVPSSPEGGLVQREWLDQHRIPAAPPHPIRTVVAVDPADSGERDSAGIVAASLTADGVVNLIADYTAKMTADEWANAAIRLAIEVGASEIHVEAFQSGTTYVRVVRDALARHQLTRPIRVTGWPPKGQSRRGDAVARSAALLQALEIGTCRLAGQFHDFEEQATRWQAGQHQPDALAALVIAHDVLAPIAGQQVSFASPLDLQRRVTDRAGVDTDRRGLRTPSAPAHPALTRRVGGGGYDPLAYSRPTIHPVVR